MDFFDEYEYDLVKLEQLKELCSDFTRAVTIRVHLTNFEYIDYNLENNQNVVQLFRNESNEIRNLLRKEKLKRINSK